jgi:SRSO17 transposase
MIKRAIDAKIPMKWIVGDSVYGSSRKLRAFLEDIRKTYALAVKCNEQVIREKKPQRVNEIANSLAPNAWQIRSCGDGSCGPRLFRWALVPLKAGEIAGWRHSLVIRQSLETGEKAPDIAYILVFAPEGTSEHLMVNVIGDRWTVEECFEVGKGEVGLDEYEVRSWQGWYRHITFCMVAMAFLVVLRLSSQTLETSSDDRENQLSQISESHEASPDPCIQTSLCNPFLMFIPFTVPEIQKLFYYLVSFKPLSTLYRIAWSTWRRAHQAVAHFYHSRRRILASPAYLQL